MLQLLVENQNPDQTVIPKSRALKLNGNPSQVALGNPKVAAEFTSNSGITRFKRIGLETRWIFCFAMLVAFDRHVYALRSKLQSILFYFCKKNM